MPAICRSTPLGTGHRRTNKKDNFYIMYSIEWVFNLGSTDPLPRWCVNLGEEKNKTLSPLTSHPWKRLICLSLSFHFFQKVHINGIMQYIEFPRLACLTWHNPLGFIQVVMCINSSSLLLLNICIPL